MTDTQYLAVAGLVNALWPNASWARATMEAGTYILADLEFDATVAAVRQMAAEGREFAPNPGQVRAATVEFTGAATSEGVPSQDRALAEVYEQIRRVGSYGTPEWSHPAIADAVKALGGWMAACMDENPEAYRAHFLRVYASVAQRRVRQAVMPPSVAEALSGFVRRIEPLGLPE